MSPYSVRAEQQVGERSRKENSSKTNQNEGLSEEGPLLIVSDVNIWELGYVEQQHRTNLFFLNYFNLR